MKGLAGTGNMENPKGGGHKCAGYMVEVIRVGRGVKYLREGGTVTGGRWTVVMYDGSASPFLV